MQSRFKKKGKIFLYIIIILLIINLFSCAKTDISNENESVKETFDETKTIIEIENSIKDPFEDVIEPRENFISIKNRDKKDVFCFAGDVFLSERPRKAYDEAGIDGIIDEEYKKVLSDCDLSVANLECSITDDKENKEEKTFTFALPTKYISAIKEIGVDLFTLANNHILDYGVDAMFNTMKLLDENGILHIGVGENISEARSVYIKEIEGKRYAFIAASAVLPKDAWRAEKDRAGVYSGYDLAQLSEEIKIVKNYVDKVIVYMHWGKELDEVSNESQKKYAKIIVNAGADLIIGAHSHTVQEIEYIDGVPVVYGLGNFIYGGTMKDTILLTATFDYSDDENGELQLKIYPGISNYTKVRRYWESDIIDVKLKDMQDKCTTCYIDYEGNVYDIYKINFDDETNIDEIESFDDKEE